MFKITKTSDTRLDIEMSGRLDAEGMSHALDEFVSKSKNIKDGVLLYDVIDFHLPTLHAIAIEFASLPSMFGLMNKFKRAAVLTDKTWLRKVSELEGVIIPGLEVKAFTRDKKAEAEAWLLHG